ncbi:unnamed protein product [marine sediment metagenome]|uniref:Resolvase/invertase-type recombinase catalytic domain-containing protein n=1 Tax=marine sediment metagenome TaxID=412755 RepID=X1CKH4_9ZZZZ
MKKVAIYLRVSTDEQEKGLQSQEHAIKQWCKNHGYKKSQVTFYRDLGKSGKNLKRPAFKKLESAIFMGKHDTVICWALNRLSRSQRDGVNLLHDWLDKDIRIVSISQQFDWSGDMGKMVAGIMFAIAEWWREEHIKATKRGLKRAKDKGIQLGKRSTLDLNEIQSMIDGGHTMQDIAKELKVSRQTIWNARKRMEPAA